MSKKLEYNPFTETLDWIQNLDELATTPTNVIEVKAGVSEIAGKRYNTVADAITYINTQSPSGSNRFTIKLLDVINTESFTLPDYVGIVGGQGFTGILSNYLMGSITLGKQSAISSCIIYGATITTSSTQAGEEAYLFYDYVYGTTINHPAGTYLFSFNSIFNLNSQYSVSGNFISYSSTLLGSSNNIVIETGGTFGGDMNYGGSGRVVSNGGTITANSVGAMYDNITSGLTADTTGSAIDEIVSTRAPLDDGTSAGQFTFWNGSKWTNTETSELFWDDTNKRVGIGTDSPAFKLDVNAGNINNVANFNSTDNNAYINIADVGGYVTLGTYRGQMRFFVNNEVTEAMRIDNDGNVGIGTDSPNRLLHIYGEVPAIRLEDSDGTDQLGEIFQSSDDLVFRSRDNTSNGGFKFVAWDGTNFTTQVVIDSDGNVGIGTDSPNTALHIVGEIKENDREVLRYVLLLS